MTTTEPAEPSPRPDESSAPADPGSVVPDQDGDQGGSDVEGAGYDVDALREAIKEERRAARRAEREAKLQALSPEELQRRAEVREARQKERRAARRAENEAQREARRQAQREAKRVAQWESSLDSARAGGDGDTATRSRSSNRPGGPREPFAIHRAAGGFPPLRPYLHQLRKRKSLIWHLARSELKGENYNTFFGQIWLILNPLLMAGVYVLGRSVIRPMGTPAERNYLICHLVAGVFFFQFTARSMNAGSRSIIGNKSMLLNTAFPRAVFPLATTVRSIFDLIPLVLTLLVVRVLLDQPTTWVYIFLPMVIGIQLLFNMGLAFATSTLMVFFRDFGNVLGFSSRLWLWTTPVLYTTAEIPERIRGVLELNPLYPMFAMYEEIFLGEVPSPHYLLWALAWTVPVFVFGVVVFLMKERDFAVRL